MIGALCIGATLASCSSEAGSREHASGDSEHASPERGEHARETDGGGEHEESGTEYGLADRYDNVRNGAHLVLAWSAEAGSFEGTVTNVTGATLKRVRVEVHLSNGLELGPTEPRDLKAGERMVVSLITSRRDFERWSAHPEVGSGEHGGR